jgi:hypothetical protein
VGYVDGEFVFIHGYGSGIGGEPYDATKPQGQVYGPLGQSYPFWCCHPFRRKVTLLFYMERRARMFKRQSGSYGQRLRVVTLKLAEQWAKDVEENERLRRDNPNYDEVRYARPRGKRKRKEMIPSNYQSRCVWLKEAGKDFPTFLQRITDDYFVGYEGAEHWDIGQITWRSNVGRENKTLVREILMTVNKIGQKRFSEPPAPAVQYVETPSEPMLEDLEIF